MRRDRAAHVPQLSLANLGICNVHRSCGQKFEVPVGVVVNSDANSVDTFIV